MKNILKKFWSDDRGIAGIEFAVLAPFLFLLLLGIIWITDTERISTQVSLVSATVGDIVARAESVNNQTIDNTLFAAEAMMAGRAADLQIYVTGIENQPVGFNPDGSAIFKPVVIWVRSRNIDDLPLPAVGSVYDVNQSLVDNVPFVVAARARFRHTPVIGPDIVGEQVYDYEHVYAPRANITLK